MSWSAPLSGLRGVGAKRAQSLADRDLYTVQDLLHLLPTRYVKPAPLKEEGLPDPEDHLSVLGHILRRRKGRLRRGGGFLEIVLEVDQGQIRARFYNQPWLFDRFPKGQRALLSGRMTRDGRTLVVEQHFVLEDGEDHADHLRTARPVLPAISGISAGVMGSLMERALESVVGLPDPLPVSLLEETGLPVLDRAFAMVHRPGSPEDVACGGARVLFDRFVAMLLPVRLRRPTGESARRFPVSPRTLERIRARFPFPFTPGQDSALKLLLGDLEGLSPMRRLLQGDVGSGKTAVALATALAVVAARAQVLFLAPTEPLAFQHREVLASFLAGSRVRLGLLHARLPAVEERRIREDLASGALDIVVATTAILSKRFVFKDLAFAIIDEQHRFGVRQRLAARAKGGVPHMLSMSATPIPRSLCLALHGDLDHVTIPDLPAGRSPTVTRIENEPSALAEVRAAVEAGARAFVVFPSIEAENMPALLREGLRCLEESGGLAGIPACFLHGRMPAPDRDASLREFRTGGARVMLATSMVEVGIDIPEATVMAIMGAERFGLASLHQLRGRVGRGRSPGTCLLVPGPNCKDPARQRLGVLERERDGFRIAEEDLDQRGPGELAGVRQAGPQGLFRLDREQDGRLFEQAHDIAGKLVADALWKPGDGSYYDHLVLAPHDLHAMPGDAV